MNIAIPTFRRMLFIGCFGCVALMQGVAVANDPLEQQRRYVEALDGYVDVQIALKNDDVRGMAELFRLGHASRLELDDAQVGLDRLVARKQACQRFLTSLDRVKTDSVAGTGQWLIVEMSSVLNVPQTVVKPIIMRLDQESQSLVAELAVADSRVRKTQQTEITARAGHVSELLEKLDRLDNSMPGELAEANRLRLQLRLFKAEQKLIAATPANVRAVNAQQYKTDGEDVDVRQLVAILWQDWNRETLHAEADGLAREIKTVQQRYERLVQLQPEGGTLFGEVDQSQAQLNRLTDARLSVKNRVAMLTEPPAYNEVVGQSSLDDELVFQTLMIRGTQTRKAASELQAARRRFAQVARLASDDPFFKGERQWLSHQVRLGEADAALAASSSEQLAAIAGLRATGETQLISTSTDNEWSFAVSLMQASSHTVNRIRKSTVQREIAAERLSALEQLHCEGHASWREVEQSRTTVRIHDAQLKTLEHEQIAESLRRQLVEQITSTTSDDTITLR